MIIVILLFVMIDGTFLLLCLESSRLAATAQPEAGNQKDATRDGTLVGGMTVAHLVLKTASFVLISKNKREQDSIFWIFSCQVFHPFSCCSFLFTLAS